MNGLFITGQGEYKWVHSVINVNLGQFRSDSIGWLHKKGMWPKRNLFSHTNRNKNIEEEKKVWFNAWASNHMCFN